MWGFVSVNGEGLLAGSLQIFIPKKGVGPNRTW